MLAVVDSWYGVAALAVTGAISIVGGNRHRMA